MEPQMATMPSATDVNVVKIFAVAMPVRSVPAMALMATITPNSPARILVSACAAFSGLSTLESRYTDPAMMPMEMARFFARTLSRVVVFAFVQASTAFRMESSRLLSGSPSILARLFPLDASIPMAYASAPTSNRLSSR